jgi:hypothetical protein
MSERRAIFLILRSDQEDEEGGYHESLFYTEVGGSELL